MNNIEFKYLNITEDDADFGLWVSTVGFQSIEPGMTYPIKAILRVIISILKRAAR